MEKNEREKQMLLEWGKENASKYVFQQINRNKESYFTQRQSDSYIREYSFEKLPEFMEELDAMWGSDETMGQIKKVVGVAAMKNKPTKVIEEKSEKREEAEEILPAFIYNF